MSFGFGAGLAQLRVNRPSEAGSDGLVAFDISGAAYSGNSYLFSGSATSGNGIYVVDTSTWMLAHSNLVKRFDMSVDSDVSTSSLTSSGTFAGTTGGQLARGLAYAAGGTRAYWTSDATDTVRQYSVATPYGTDLTFINDFSTSPTVGTTRDIAVSEDERFIYLTETTADIIAQYEMTTPGDMTTAVLVGTIGSAGTSPDGLVISPDGLALFVGDQSTKTITQYDMTVAHDMTTAVAGSTLDTSTQMAGIFTGFGIDPSGSILIAIDFSNHIAYQYNL